MEIAIREMEPADAEQVSQLVAQLGYERSPAEIREWMDALRGEHRQQAAFVAVLEGEILGWIEISIERRLQSPPFALIGGLVVKNGVRSRGIGRQLCTRAEAWAWGATSIRCASPRAAPARTPTASTCAMVTGK